MAEPGLAWSCLSLSSDVPELVFRLGDTLSTDIWILSAVISDFIYSPSLQLYTWSSYKLSTGRQEPLWLQGWWVLGSAGTHQAWDTTQREITFVPASSEG